MSEEIVQLNEEIIKGQIKKLVRGSTDRRRLSASIPFLPIIHLANRCLMTDHLSRLLNFIVVFYHTSMRNISKNCKHRTFPRKNCTFPQERGILLKKRGGIPMNTPDAAPVALDTWPRREAYTFFSGLSDPFYSVTVTVDVTALHTYTKRRGLSFYYALVWLCTQSINQTTAFRYAIRNGQPVLLARREPSFTDLHPGAEQFHIVTMPAGDALEDFCRAARAKSRAQTEFLSAAAESDALIYFSCLPWVSLTALTNERDFDADDAIPRIAWGKYHREGERDVLGLALEVNHRLIDGLHIGQFVQDLQQRIDALAEAE